MPKTIDDELNEIDDNDPGSGSKLRKLVQSLSAENRDLRTQVTESKAKDTISTQRLTFVKVDDLVNVPLEELETKAAELEEQRKADFESTLRARFEAQGLTGAELDNEVARLLDGQKVESSSGTEVPEGVFRARSLEGATVGPVPKVNPANLTARQKLDYAFSQPKKRS